MYRPTVRYEDCFREYVDSLFHSTTLDRNQIIRLGLFLLGHTKEGREVLNQFATSPLPNPLWEQNSHVLWYGKPLEMSLEVGTSKQVEGVTSDVNKESIPRPERETPRHEHREIHSETKSEPIIFRVGNTLLLPRRG